MTQDPGPMPTPQAEPPELYPGGADAIVDDGSPPRAPGGPVGADLPSAVHPAGEATPDEVTEPDDKRQEPAPEAEAEQGPGEDEGEPEPPA